MLAVIVLSSLTPDPVIWQHLLDYALPELLNNTLWLVLGVSPGSVNALHHMPLPADLVDATPNPVTPTTGFAARLAQLTQPNKANPHAPR